MRTSLSKFSPLFLLFLSYNLIAQVNLKDGLIAYYPFNGNANDESGNNNNPVFNNASLTEDKSGNKKSAYYFDGVNDYIRIKNNAQLSPDQITLVAIVKPMGFYMGTCYNNSIIDKGSWDYLRGNYALRFTAGEYTQGDCYNSSLAHQNFVGMVANIGGSTSKEEYVKLNNWYCVVFTFSKQSSTLYLNGRLISTTKYNNATIGKRNEDIFIGKKDNEQYPYRFKGVMDEIRIYNRALNSDEVLALCNIKKTVSPEDPCPESKRPNADFNYSLSECKKVSFEPKMQDQKNIRSITWSFGDGNSSSKKSPSYQYSKYGKFKVKAIVVNNSGCADTSLREIQITELKTDFTFTEQGEPGTIQFKAKNNNAAYSWNFGDGNKAKNESFTSHSYSESGQYVVQMMAQNNSGCKDTVEKRIVISLPVFIIEAPPPNPIKTINTTPEVKLEKRDKDVVRTISVENDSISVSLYDNGIIDGDSITLIYNNEIMVAHQLLSSKPLTLSLKIDRQKSSNELVMYAENLGSIPPNTALMIINDGNNRYQVNVTSSKSSNGIISFTIKK